MLLYNHRQEFIGIDTEGLRLLNYSTMSDLLNVCNDVADLFANEPGYIHNFKNFGWIDFLLHADSDASSAIVHANGRVFSCKLSVSSFYLSENPLQNGYAIDMSHIQTLSGEDIKPHTIVPKTSPKEYITPPVAPKLETPSPLPDYTHLTPTQLKEPSVLDIPNLEISAFDEIEEPVEKTYLPSNTEESFIDDLTNSPFKTFIETETPIAVTKPLSDKPMLGSARYNAQEKECLERHSVVKTYVYDPHVAANELGLPVDLIEEFIGDFIQQSLDFKDALFESSAKNDFNNLHILSHKLKGVAANLRIEDAFETLSVINTSSDTLEIEANLKFYFDIIRKLSGEKIEDDASIDENVEVKTPAIIEKTADDIYHFGLKQHDDEPLIVHENDTTETSEEPLFEKVRLDLHESFTKAETPSTKDDESKLDIDSSYDEPIEEISLKDDESTLDIDSSYDEALVEIPTEIDTTSEEELSLDTETAKIYYDKSIVAQSLGISPSFMDELLFDYKNDSRLISNQITEAIKAFDTVSWNTNAAKLKGISDNLRLTEISEELAILSKTHDAQEAKKASLRLNAYLDQL